MDELIDFAEKAGMENIKFRLQNSETLAKEASSTLTILLSGIGGAMIFAAKIFEGSPPKAVEIGAFCFSIWLIATAMCLVINCILSTDIQTPTNQPMNLYQKEFSLDAIRVVELRNLDARIELIAARNHRIAAWLDRVRISIIVSPIVFFLITGMVLAVR
jgi:hypothetical protein